MNSVKFQEDTNGDYAAHNELMSRYVAINEQPNTFAVKVNGVVEAYVPSFRIAKEVATELYLTGEVDLRDYRD